MSKEIDEIDVNMKRYGKTPQHITPHKDILIQQAYDRGYADKAMKVDEAIEMEHSAKGCTRKCHTEPTIDELHSNPCIKCYACDFSKDSKCYKGSYKQCSVCAVIQNTIEMCQALIANQVREAQIQEVERFLVEPGEVIPYNNNTFAEGFRYVVDKLQDRLAALKGDDK